MSKSRKKTRLDLLAEILLSVQSKETPSPRADRPDVPPKPAPKRVKKAA